MRRFLWVLLVLVFVSIPALAKPYSFRGQTFQLNPLIIEGKPCFSLDDKEVRRLVDSTYAQVQFSSASTSVYFFLPGRQSFWSERSDTVTLNGLELPAAGMYFPERKALQPGALFFALGLRAFEDKESISLLPVVTSMSTEPPKGGEVAPEVLPLVLKFASPTKPTAVTVVDASGEPAPQWFALEFPDCAWDEELCPRKVRLPEADCEVTGGDGPGKTVTLRCHLRPFWDAKLQLDVAGTARIVFEPRHLGRTPKEETVLERVEMRPGESLEGQSPDRLFRFILDKATTFTWIQNEGQLYLEFPATQMSSLGLKPPADCQLSQVRTSRYPIVRFQTPLESGQSFDFVEVNDPPHTMVLRIAPKGKYKNPESFGMATTGGYLGGGASGTVVIDPGHGGGDSGCQNRGLGVFEKDITLDISLRLARLLQQRGWKVVMTRNDDRDVTYAGSPDAMELEARANVANEINADIFVSIHCNASVNYGARGSSVYYYKDEDYPLAQSLDVLGSAVGFEELGVIQNRFAVLRLTRMPAALVETAFLSNPNEGSMLADGNVRQAIAERLAQGLERYMASKKAAR